jgi:glycosyltransferase involved in cell wall biosynthesis
MTTIKSLFNQSYPKDRFEIIVIDNASKDGTEKMMQLFLEQTPDTLRYYRKKGEGPGPARNLGLSKARGSIIAFTEDDCVADTDWIKNGVAKIGNGVGLVQGKTVPNPHQPKTKLSHSIEVFWESGFYQTCNMFYRKDVLDLVGGSSTDFSGSSWFGLLKIGGEDTDLAWRVKKKGWKSVFADDAVIYHHIFDLSPWKALFRQYQFIGVIAFPRIIKRHPELRNTILYRKLFKSKQRALFYLLLLSLFLGFFIHAAFFIFGLPYLGRILKVSFYRRQISSYHRGLALLGIIIFHEFINSILLMCTSVIFRTIIL